MARLIALSDIRDRDAILNVERGYDAIKETLATIPLEKLAKLLAAAGWTCSPPGGREIYVATDSEGNMTGYNSCEQAARESTSRVVRYVQVEFAAPRG